MAYLKLPFYKNCKLSKLKLHHMASLDLLILQKLLHHMVSLDLLILQKLEIWNLTTWHFWIC